MANSIIRATACEIDIAGISVTGLMLPNGEYRMSDADIARAVKEHLNAPARYRKLIENNSSLPDAYLESLKPLIDKGCFTVQKVKFQQDSGRLSSANTSNIMFASAFWTYKSRMNDSAFALVSALATETIERRFDRAFNQKVSEAEYDARLALRLQRLEARRSWTDVIKERLEQQELYGNRVYASSVFKDLTVQVNLALFGQPHFRCDRDNMTIKQQNLVGSFETLCARKAEQFPSDTAEELVEKVLLCF